MKKIIVLFLILSILIVGCKSYSQPADKPQPIRPQPSPNPAVGGECGVIESKNQETSVTSSPH